MTSPAQISINKHMFVGFAMAALLVFGVGGWAATTEIAGAVMAQGTIVVDSNVKRIQHAAGGTVGEIMARDGDVVEAGAKVLQLDDTIARANLTIVEKRLIELIARKARLVSERDGSSDIEFPTELTKRLDEPQVRQITRGERKLFNSLKQARSGQKAQLQERVSQIREDIKGTDAQLVAKAKEFNLIQEELKGARKLWSKNLMPITKLTALERQATEIQGAKAELTSKVAQAKGRIAEILLQIIQIDRDHIANVSKELSQTDAQIGEFVERRIAAQDQLRRVEIRAPQAGTIHQSIAHTVGGVIQAGETIMLVVPRADNLTVEARVEPQDIDQLSVGQPATLRFSAFNQRVTPETDGTVSRISADITNDARSGIGYYTVRISLQPDQLARLGTVQLIPGMPVEVFIKTEDRKVLSYLLKPMTDQVARAFREQ
ncbi:MAG: HlyD family type I secretion periplasmic adaptor subunit [Pseudomonadota bacterium]